MFSLSFEVDKMKFHHCWTLRGKTRLVTPLEKPTIAPRGKNSSDAHVTRRGIRVLSALVAVCCSLQVLPKLVSPQFRLYLCAGQDAYERVGKFSVGVSNAHI